MKKPTRIITDPSEMAAVYANTGTQSQEEAIRSILVQNGVLKPRWPRMRDIPEADRQSFTACLEGKTRPLIDGESDENQDAFYQHDYERWKRGLPVVD
jgi:hypothetical protein